MVTNEYRSFCQWHPVPLLYKSDKVLYLRVLLQESHRQQQLQRVCALIRTLPEGEPVVLAGDFNDWRHRAHEVLRRDAGLHEVFVHAFGRAQRTFPASMPLLALDRIYVRNAAVHTPLKLPHKPWDKLSDHAPLAAEILL